MEIVLGNNFGKFSGIILKAIFDSNFGAQLSRTALQTNFGELFWGIGLQSHNFGAPALDCSFGGQLSGVISTNNFGEQLWRAIWLIFRNSFEYDLL